MQAIAIKYEDTAYIFHGISVKDVTQVSLILKKLAEKQHQLPKGYYLRHDIARVPNSQNNIHVFRRNRMLGSFNQDGSSHDNSNFRIPRVVTDYIAKTFPDFTIPDGRYVEASSFRDDRALLLLEDIKKGKKFETMLVIDLNEEDVVEPDQGQIKLLKDLLDYFN